MANSFNLGIEKTNIQCQWTWELTITDGVKVATVGYPLTIDFNIVRNTFASANTGTFSIYNLSPSTRSLPDNTNSTSSGLFFQDRFNTNVNKFLTFKAGYEGNLVTCFYGRVQEAYSRRQGTEVITEIQCMDMGIPTDYVNVTFEAGTTRREAFENVAQNLQGVSIGAIGLLEGVYKTPVTFGGTPLEVLNEISGGNTFIDNGVINCLQPNECLDLGVTILNAKTGLINTPQRRGSEIVCEGIFNPNATVGQLMEIQAETSKELSGSFELTGITHTGTISGAVSGTRITRYNFLVGALLPNGKYTTTGTTERLPFTKVKGNDRQPVSGNVGSDVYAVFNYIKSHNGQPPTSKVGHTNFTWKQLLLPAGTGNTASQIFNQITLSYLQNSKVIAEMLYDFVQVNFAGRSVNIVSNWRSRENNASLSNAAKESVHLRGGAIDFNIVGVPTQIAFKKFYNAWSGFTYRYKPTSGDYMIHVQSGRGAGGALRLQGQIA